MHRNASIIRHSGVNKKDFTMWKIVCNLEEQAGEIRVFKGFFDKLGNKNVLRKVSHD
jgi:hypothetical protein